MTRVIRRRPTPQTIHEAAVRVWEAEGVVAELKGLARRARAFPHTQAYIRRCLKSAEGAVRHAQRLHSQLSRSG